MTAPKDISLIAGCDSALCKWVYPGLTAIDNHIKEKARNGTKLIIELLEKQIDFQMALRRNKDLFCPSELILRGSSGLVPKT